MKLLDKIKDSSAFALYPVRCPYCDRVIEKNEVACRSCAEQFPDHCITRAVVGGLACAAALPYRGSYAGAVRRLKFSNRADYARPLAVQTVHAILEISEDMSFDLITCVPMHVKDIRIRGYNQAELLARECAAVMKLPYVETLEKFKRNRPQHETKAKDRGKNVRGVFRPTDCALFRNKHVLIIDDIITTGNTLGECARMLFLGGCREISCAAVCATSAW